MLNEPRVAFASLRSLRQPWAIRHWPFTPKTNCIIDSVVGETVSIRYADSRQDTPDIANPSLTFQVGGTLGDNLKAALVNYNKPGFVAPSLGQLFNELAEPLGIDPASAKSATSCAHRTCRTFKPSDPAESHFTQGNKYCI